MLRKATDVPRWAWILGIAAIAVSFVVAFSPVVKDVYCDGAYERWRVPDDYDGSGCAELVPAWHGIFPWNQDTEMICFGYASTLRRGTRMSPCRMAGDWVLCEMPIRTLRGDDHLRVGILRPVLSR